MRSLVKRGTCHIFGDGIPLDEGVMPFKYAIERVTDPERLIPHLFESIDAGFATRVKRGDIVLAGGNFAHGKPHVQGFIAMAALDMGIVCGSMPYKILRRAVAKGVPVIVGAPALADFAQTGDEVEIDFATGATRNLTRGTATSLPGIPPILLDIVAQGGMNGLLTSWLKAHPEQAAGDTRTAAPDDILATPVSLVKRKAE